MTVCDWKWKQNDIEKWVKQSVSGGSVLARKTMRKGEYQHTSDVLFVWFSQLRGIGSGSVFSVTEDDPKPQCVCYLFAILVKRIHETRSVFQHLDTKYQKSNRRSLEFFKINLEELKRSQHAIKYQSKCR